ncbi:MAG: hypothetical protein AB1714_22620 [Acidobacteriota bacterium]
MRPLDAPIAESGHCRSGWFRARRMALLIGLFAIGALIVTWPLGRDMSHQLVDEGDPLLYSWVIEWVHWALLNSPSQLFSPPIFYPEKWALTYSDTLLLPATLVMPVLALGGSGILAHNILLLLSFVLTGVFFYWMCRELCLGHGASIVGAVLFAFSTFRMDFSHLQLSQVQYFPLQVLFLNRFFRLRMTRDLLLSWGAVLATILSCSYYGVYAVLLMAILHLFYLCSQLRGLSLRTLLTIAGAPTPVYAAILLSTCHIGRRSYSMALSADSARCVPTAPTFSHMRTPATTTSACRRSGDGSTQGCAKLSAPGLSRWY